MDKNNYCVIMAGGVGSRFWPMSRTSYPKQFIDILGTGETLLQSTFRRFLKVCNSENIYIVTNESYKDLVIKQIPGISEDQIISEPTRRNTAPCIAYASYKIFSRNKNANLIVAPSDHIIMKEDEFVSIINSALEAASKNNWLITLGITPNRPDTGYGYIQHHESDINEEDKRIYKVKTFTEKPTLEIAQTFLESGDFLWNSGIFVWNINSILEAFKLYAPDIQEAFEKGDGIYNTDLESEFISRTYASCKSISIDYSIMEHAKNVHVIKSDFGWSDLGTWGSLYEIRNKNDQGNAVVGKNVLMYESSNCIVNIPNNKLAVLQGLNDYIVVESDNVILVCKKTDEQQIRKFVNDVRNNKGDHFV